MTNLQEYGLHLINRYNLKEKRLYFTFNYNDLSNNVLIDFISNLINKNITEYEIINRTFNNNENLNYHIDDCQIVKLKEKPKYNQEKYIQINNNKYLFINNKYNKLATYTCVLFLSTYNIDFTGGEFMFADDTIIYPIQYNGIIFDGREVHKVNNINSGKRETIVIKIYN
jgi:hypothetical protein